jgi:hypothetical protein
MRQMNRLIEIDDVNMTATAEAGIINSELAAACESRGFQVHTASVPVRYTTLGGVLSGVVGGGIPHGLQAHGLDNQFLLGLKIRSIVCPGKAASTLRVDFAVFGRLPSSKFAPPDRSGRGPAGAPPTSRRYSSAMGDPISTSPTNSRAIGPRQACLKRRGGRPRARRCSPAPPSGQRHTQHARSGQPCPRQTPLAAAGATL